MECVQSRGPVFTARRRGRWLLGTVHPLPCCCARNTNGFHCASNLDARPSRPNESFVTPLSFRLSRSLTGTLFWWIGYSAANEFFAPTVIDTWILFREKGLLPMARPLAIAFCVVVWYLRSNVASCHHSFRSVTVPFINVSKREL